MATTATITRSYSELIQFETFEERYEYLRLLGTVGRETFGFDRRINQKFYRSKEWKRAREYVILRDEGCDLGIFDREIHTELLIHHMNPIGPDDLINRADWVLNPEYLITTQLRTHNAIHFGRDEEGPPVVFDRTPGDTTPWRR